MRGLAEQLFDAVGILDPRQLHDDPVVTLLRDLGVHDTRLINAAADDFNRLLHG